MYSCIINKSLTPVLLISDLYISHIKQKAPIKRLVAEQRQKETTNNR
jgi:hypothetical protein